MLLLTIVNMIVVSMAFGVLVLPYALVQVKDIATNHSQGGIVGNTTAICCLWVTVVS